MVKIKGLDKAEVFRCLYNNAKWKGFTIVHVEPRDMGIEEARNIISKQTYFSQVLGRNLNVDLSSDIEFEELLYDRDNGKGIAQKVVDDIMSKYKIKSGECYE